ncbi:uncharacterized protein L3040_002419 [Drepanopeziza brunnea f. sp. 'multigermtubi']|uniref:uncharacterized protein n=1 Tax=Drepanopeziza brunnea f. sp. 'multigermtubi' TaxID=698441 RepID=UPI0023870746|nr:hypothetical protein L3040_002419 [Drepanopeziza brunnea f. sp. 'multigermtubi']
MLALAASAVPHNRRQELASARLITTSGVSFPPVATSISTSRVAPSVPIISTVESSGTVQILPSLSTTSPNTKGTIVTSLQTSGKPTLAPLLSAYIPVPSKYLASVVPTLPEPSVAVGQTAQNIFQPIEAGAPPSVIPRRGDHPAPKVGINQQSPIQTNKFYGNFFLGGQSQPTWTHPYILNWAKGGGPSQSWGLAINHLDDSMKTFGGGNPAEYFVNAGGLQSVVLSALELGASTALTGDGLTAFSANIHLSPRVGAAPVISFAVVQGMGFVTGVYNGGTPILHSGVFFRSLTRAAINPKPDVAKYTIVLEDGKTWLVYAYSPSGQGLELKAVGNGLIKATSNFNGVIQIAKNPGGDAEAIYDESCGNYATSASVSGSAHGSQGSYTLSFTKAGRGDSTLAMFSLPHHVQSFSSQTAAGLTDVRLATTTKGMARLVRADSWTLLESLPTTMGFAPGSAALSASAKEAIHAAATIEVAQDMSEVSDGVSMYFSGKILAKYAQIVYVLYDLLDDKALGQAGLDQLKRAYARFTSNKQQKPLFYDSSYGGLVSSAGYNGDTMADFGNTMYNDHHFHYGYFVYAAAIIGYLDPTWLPANKPWVQALVRDYANPSADDAYFPESRSFDWYHGHSWAHGVMESGDGKDEESSSEDSMAAYALKMWGRTTGDANMEARGNLQLALTARSLQSYFLYASDNSIEPARFIGNKVCGILFESRMHHTTYFGRNIEYVQGIHMLPLLPASTLTRTRQFVREEWDTFFSHGRADAVAGGWRGVLFANLALVDPRAAWNFFAQPAFDDSYLDGGASRTWYLTFAAGLGGA